MKPILFSTEMVRAILDGRKTMTRRVIKPQPPEAAYIHNGYRDFSWSMWPGGDKHVLKPPYHCGDDLYVRETWAYHDGAVGGVIYKARCPNGLAERKKWNPSIHMPKEAARIFLRVTDVHIERLQYITEKQAKEEGACKAYPYTDPTTGKTEYMQDEHATYYGGFSSVWNATIKPADRDRFGWDANPWVWVIEFKTIDKEEQPQ